MDELDDSDAILDTRCYLRESLEDPTAIVIVASERFLCQVFSSKS